MNTQAIERLIRLTANRIGIDIKRYKDDSSEYAKIVKMLKSNGINLVIDIGANHGQYAKILRRYGYLGRIISFEPLRSAWTALEYASRNDSAWDVFPRCAIGDIISSEKINISRNSVSSSLLEMLDQHAKSAPDSAYIAEESVDIITLDHALDKIIKDDNERMFIKIDTQGYEQKVLMGATQSITDAIGIQVELSFVPLYQNQELFAEILQRLTDSGFSIWSIFPGFTDPYSGRMLQCDAVLFRN
jgi:FkbM family methyltransferase